MSVKEPMPEAEAKRAVERQQAAWKENRMEELKKEQEPPKPPEASIEVTADSFVIKAPFALGKMGVYGILEMAKEEAAKFFYRQEKLSAEIKKASQESGSSILSRLNLPFGRKR